MLKNEALWIGEAIGKIPKSQIGRVLDIGSEVPFFRNIRQSYINRYIFIPLKNRGIDVVHTDIELNVVGGDFSKKVKKMGTFKTVFAFNLLEHVEDFQKAARNIVSVIPESGHLFVSCPKYFPYHPDPIDNGFRPTQDELADLFSSMKIIKKATVSQKLNLMITRRGILVGKRYSASCLILEKHVKI